MPNLIVKQYDTYPPLQATLTDVNGPINLSSASSVKVILKGQKSLVVVKGNCAITTPLAGIVTYTWATNDTGTADIYAVEFEITWAGGGVQTVPNAAVSNPTIEVDADLEGI